MFENIFKTKKGKKIELLIDGMHCTSCATNIDLSLEELPGIKKADTNYARNKTVLEIEEKDFDKERVLKVVKKLGYNAKFI
jgi:P-type Cu+ transporter